MRVKPVTPEILACSLGNCVHVAGPLAFLELARSVGYETTFLGAATPVDKLLDAIEEHDPDLVAVSYRLTPEVSANLFDQLDEGLRARGLEGLRLVLGGTPPVGRAGEEAGLFEAIFTGGEGPEEVLDFLRGEATEHTPDDLGTTLVERIAARAPMPLLRHHFGQPTVEATIEGAARIAEAEAVDVISIGPDQNAQEHFFDPEEMDPELDGAGGVPLRTPDDLRAIYQASRRGNHPLVRCYSGTRDLIRWAEVHVATIANAWGAIPLCWYNTLDGRSNRPPEESIPENIEAMRWYAERGRPVECNEAHHWSMRDAHDTIAVATAYLGAYVCKSVGVTTYVSQYMFNSPANTSAAMDLAKMLAKVEMIESLCDDGFSVMHQTRAGLMCFSPNPDVAKGQLAASTVLQLQLQPQIVHVVGFCEGDHAATVEDIVESCEIVRGAMHQCLDGMPDMAGDPRVQARKNELVSEAHLLLDAIRALGEAGTDALADPQVITRAIGLGYLDAPHLCGNEWAAGRLVTMPVDGAIRAINPDTGEVWSEEERLTTLGGGSDRS
jgi:methylmalonyl-CoA mutase cobalamin-binding subunit